MFKILSNIDNIISSEVVRQKREENSMIEINTSKIMRADQITLGEFEDMAINDFDMHVTNLFYDKKDYVQSSLYNTSLYKVFVMEECKLRFKLNPKNINFEKIIIDTRELLKRYKTVHVDGACLRVIKDQNKRQQEKSNPTCINEIKNWEELFGKGEFPYLIIRAFRLGNTEYFTYSITK